MLNRAIRAFAPAVLISCACAAASAEPFVVPIDTAQSTITVTLTLQGQSATDSSPVAGSITGELRSVNTPTEILVSDFQMTLTETLVLNISFGIFGAFNSTVTGFEIEAAQPGVPQGPVPITSGMFTFTGVPTNFFGFLNYTATGLVCTALQGSGLPCAATQDLSADNPRTTDALSGTVTSVNRLVTLVSTFDQTSPIDPANPGLGTVRVRGTIRGSVTVPVPCAGDADGDGFVGLADVAAIIQNWGNTGAPRIPGDLDEDGLVGLSDIAQVISNWDMPCP